MSRVHPSVADLRQMLAARFPQTTGKPVGGVSTGVAALDEALGGGLPIGRLTELVVETPGCGGQSVLSQLLRTTRAAWQRVALLAAADFFAPEAFPADTLRHLVWVRCASLEQTRAAADLLVRTDRPLVPMSVPERVQADYALLIAGRVQNEQDVIHVLAESIAALPAPDRPGQASHDYH